jgi:hypothetical protein
VTEEYRTPVGNTVQRFEGFHDAAKGGNPVTLEVTLDVASDVVEGLAPRPEKDADGNWPTDYVRRAKNGELMVARYIWDTDAGQTSSQTGVIGTSISYQSNPQVIEIVKGAMGKYAEEKREEGASGIAYIGRL